MTEHIGSILLVAVALLQLTSTISNIILAIVTTRNKVWKEECEEKDEKIKIKDKKIKEQADEIKTIQEEYLNVYAELQEKTGRLNQIDQVPMRNFNHPESL